MKIVNPLFDLSFKFLMENEKYAKKVLSVILDQEVVEITPGQQESVWPSPAKQLSYFRLDYKAVIRKADGSKQKVLLELQKSKSPGDIQRFRTYLGANYMSSNKEADLVREHSPDYFGAYPLITIYILGYNMPEIPYMAVKVNRDVVDSVSKKRVKVKSSFIDHLTHEAHIIQVLRLPEKRRSRLEQFLTIFNQAWCTDQEFILDLKEVPEEFEDIAMYLQGPLIDEQSRRNLAFEEEMREILDSKEETAEILKNLRKEIARARKTSQIAIKQKEQAEKQKEQAEKQKEQAEKQKNELQKKSRKMALQLAAIMKKYGASVEDIVRETGLAVEEINKRK